MVDVSSMLRVLLTSVPGEILFGGYDTGKFTGPLVAVDLADQQEDDDYFR